MKRACTLFGAAALVMAAGSDRAAGQAVSGQGGSGGGGGGGGPSNQVWDAGWRVWREEPVLPVMEGYDVEVALDSGLVESGNAIGENAEFPSGAPEVVYSALITEPGAAWLRLAFSAVELSGDPANDNATIIRLTSVADGAVQVLDGESAADWQFTSAYFNGDSVVLEVIAYPGTGASRVAVGSLTAGVGAQPARSICGTTDDRVLSFDDRNARHMPIGCSAWVINDLNSMFLTAGHCSTGSGDVMQFQVPLSTSGGTPVAPPPEHQYAVATGSVQQLDGGVGNDYGYFGVSVNSVTGLTPFQAYGVRHTLAATAPTVSGQTIRITGYGTTSAPVDNRWNQVQKTHAGPYKLRSGTQIGYHTDTTGGNSGSCVLNDNDGTAIGVHTHGGCSTSGSSYNSGTGIHNSGLQNALNNPIGVCASGRGTPTGSLYALGDAVNNFGTCNTSTGNFAKKSEVAAQPQGLAYNWTTGTFYAVDSARRLYTVTTAGAFTLLGTITGTASTLNGLAYDGRDGVLYAYAASNGQLFRVNTTTLVATTVGPTRGGNTGGIDFDPVSRTLYGVNDSGGTKLVIISTVDGALTTIGSLGGGISDCNGLAYHEADGMLYTINAGNEQLLRINPATGSASVVGASGALFGAQTGMAAVLTAPACAPDWNDDGTLDAFDYDDFVSDYFAYVAFGTGFPDYNEDGTVDAFDYDDFVSDYFAGCL